MNDNSDNFIVACLVVLFGIPALLLLLNIYRAGVPTQMGFSWSQCDFIETRRKTADSITGSNRVVFFGLSNVVVGVRTDVAASVLQRPVVNMGMNANLTNGLIYEVLETTLKSGDTLVLILPYFYFGADTRIEDQFFVVRDYIFDCSPTAYRRLSAVDFLRLAFAQNPIQVVEGVIRKVQAQTGVNLGRKTLPDFPLFQPASNGGAFNASGDWMLNSERMRASDYRDNVQRTSIGATSGFNKDGDSVLALKAFLSHASDKGVKLIATWPAAYISNHEGLAQVAEEIRAFYRENRVPMVGEPDDYLYPIDRYFDSANHLTTEAAEIYTREIAEQLRPQLEPPRLPN